MVNNFDEFKSELKKRVVEFSYTKLDGSIREARGTTNVEEIKMIGEEFLPKGDSNYNVNEFSTRYFDIDKNAWRSFRNDNFVEFKIK